MLLIVERVKLPLELLDVLLTFLNYYAVVYRQLSRKNVAENSFI